MFKLMASGTTFHFEGKRALVTGAGRGIGRAIAKALAASGAVTFALSRSREPLDSLVAECPDIRPVYVDLSDLDSAVKAVEAICPIDLLVNNAGSYHEELFVDVDMKSFDSTMNLNVKSVIAVSQVVVKSMIARQSPGAIVNVSSDSAFSAFPKNTSYGASKAALDMASRVMAIELGRHQIRVNVVNPSFVNTDAIKEADPEMCESYMKRIPLGRWSEVEDVSNAVLFLLSDSARMITGANLVIDGGLSVVG